VPSAFLTGVQTPAPGLLFAVWDFRHSHLPNSNATILASFTELHQKIGWLSEWASSCPRCANLILVCPNFCTKFRLPLFFFLFFTGCLGSPALHSLFLLSSLLTWWLFEAREEPFHNSRYPLNYSLNIWWEAFEFKFHVFFVSIFMNYVELKPSWWKGSSSMVIHEVLGWNKVHPRDIIYTCTSSIKWNFIHTLFICFGINVITCEFSMNEISLMNMHKILWMKDWTFME
jgi:hypothetical protein